MLHDESSSPDLTRRFLKLFHLLHPTTVGHPHALTSTIFADPVRRLAVCLALVAIQTVRQKTPPPFGGTAGFRIASIAGPNRALPVKWSRNRLYFSLRHLPI